MKSRTVAIVISLAMMAVGAACSEEPVAPEPKAAKKEAPVEQPTVVEKAAQQIEQVEELKKPEVTEVIKMADTAQRLRDPFRSYFTEVLIAGGDTGPITEVPPLQQYEVDQFTVLGIIFGVATPTALVADPMNQTHTVKIGTIIGRNWGKVIKIRKDAVVVNEEYTDSNSGEFKVNTIILPIKLKKLGGFSATGGEIESPAAEDMEIKAEDASEGEVDRLKRFQDILDAQQNIRNLMNITGTQGTTTPGGVPGSMPR